LVAVASASEDLLLAPRRDRVKVQSNSDDLKHPASEVSWSDFKTRTYTNQQSLIIEVVNARNRRRGMRGAPFQAAAFAKNEGGAPAGFLSPIAYLLLAHGVPGLCPHTLGSALIWILVC
jgi:hypothetical protein